MNRSRVLQWVLVACAWAWCGLPSYASGAGSTDADHVRSLLRDGYYASADSAARVLVAAARANPGNDSLALADATDLLVEAQWRLGKSRRAETRALAEMAVRVKERALGPDHPGLAMSLQNLGHVCFYAGEGAAARNGYRRALSIEERAPAKDSLAMATALAASARAIADSSGKAAQPMFEQALAIRERALPSDHPDVARSLYQLGWMHRKLQDYSGAIALYERALAIQERVLQPNHPDLAATLYQYAYVLFHVGERARARALHERALAIREVALGPDHYDVGWSLCELGDVCVVDGDYRKARDYLPRAVAIFEKNPGSDNPASLGAALLYLGSLYMFSGDYADARKTLERAIAEKERLRGRDHPEVANVLDFYGQVFELTNDMAQAKSIYERALAIRQNAYGSDDPRNSLALANLANVCSGLHEYARAESLNAAALAAREKAAGMDSPTLVELLVNYGMMRVARGDLRGAAELAERARRIAETHAPGGYEEAYADNLLGNVAVSQGRDHDARRALERADSLRVAEVGTIHPEIADIRYKEGVVLAETGDRSGALERALDADRISREHLELTMRSLSERQALDYAAARPPGLDLALMLVEKGLDPRARSRVWDAGIRDRALVLDEIGGRHRRVSDIGRGAKALSEASERLANLTVRGPGDDPEGYARLLQQAREARDRAERELAETSVDFRQQEQVRDAGLAEVAAALPEQSALVAYFDFSRWERHVPDTTMTLHGARWYPPESVFVKRRSYVAFVLRSGEAQPDVVPLGSGATIDSLVARWSQEVSRGAHLPKSWLKDATYRPVGEVLRRAVWDPLAPHLGDAKRVFLVTDGALNLVNFATLPIGDTGYLVETGPLLHVLAAERDLIRHDPSGPEGSGLLALGGPNYDGRPGETTAPAAFTSSAGAAPSAAAYRGGLTTCSDFATVRWDALPGTIAEVRDVATSWRASEKPTSGEGNGETKTSGASGVTVLTGLEASETAFKRLAPGHRVLHIATHGFFLNGQCSSSRAAGGPTAPLSNVSSRTTDESPLLLSGLALAGSNRRSQAAEGEDDGVLTAEEVAALDLSGVEWAVLSACETGVGEVRSSEGVFGLRRAFQIAGARTLVMSLWSVDDEATRAWMKALYQARFERGLSTAEAVREASLSLLRERRAKRQSVHPFYWGAFVAAGDWR